MKPYTKSVINLFDGKKRFLIPLYQRHYAWKANPQLELLWEDIERAVDRLKADRSAAAPHFMGPIVVSQMKTFGNEVQAFEVIDGQQRLTTFQLLLAAFRDVAAKTDSDYAAEARRYLVNEGLVASERERCKLWPSMTDRRSFVAIVDPDVDLNTIAPAPSDEDGAVRNSTAAYEFFRARIAEYVDAAADGEESAFSILFEALRDGLAVVSIELEGGDDPQTIFETLNSRGVDLTPSDLMRNFIFQRAKGLGQADGSLKIDELYAKTWLPLDSWFWKESEGRGRRNAQRLDWLLSDHLSMHKAEQISIDRLFEDYRRWILNDRPFTSVEEELDSIVSSAGIERRLMERDRTDPLGRFGIFADAFDVSTAMPLVLFLATEDGLEEDLGAALERIESFILRRDICGLTTANYNKLFVEIVVRLRRRSSVTLEAVEEELAHGHADTSSWPTDETFRMGWLGRDQYKPARQPRLRYLLGEINRKRHSAYGEDAEIKADLTVEHIMPRKWQTHWPIPGTEDVPTNELDFDAITRGIERTEAVNKIGNLTLLTQKLNTAGSNAAFETKMPKIKANTSLALNRDLQDYDKWNEETIRERGSALFELARGIWCSPITSAATDSTPSPEGC